MAPPDILAYVVRIFESLEIPYFVTGSIASMLYGEPRFTNDIDIVASVEPEHNDELLTAFPPQDFYLSKDAIKDALRHGYQFNIIHPASGFKIDVMVSSGDEFDKSRFSRLRKLTVLGNLTMNVASPEDVIIKKMEYYREGASEKHLRDIMSMMKISHDLIDRDYIEKWVEKKGLRSIWDSLKERFEEERR